MRKTSIFSVIVATLVFTTGCATSSENNTETTVASTAHGPAGGECKVFALAPPPTGELAGSSGTAMGWSGSNKKKSNEPLPSTSRRCSCRSRSGTSRAKVESNT